MAQLIAHTISGLSVSTAGSIMEAIRNFGVTTFDAVVIEFTDPALDHIRAMRLSGRTPRIGIIVTDKNISPEDSRYHGSRAEEAGADRFLLEPFEKNNDLATAVRQVWDLAVLDVRL
jgi:CheY-like chemotaxis protein